MSLDDTALRVPLVLLGSYGLGCLCSGYYLVRFGLQQDVREFGTGSAGGTNAARQLGTWALPLVFALDATKGAAATTGARIAGLGGLALGAAMLAVVLGHVLPLQLGFRGGRGVSTSMGALLVAYPVILLALVVLIIASVLILRRRILGGMVAYAVLPLVTLALRPDVAAVLTVALLSGAVIAAHFRRPSEFAVEGG